MIYVSSLDYTKTSLASPCFGFTGQKETKQTARKNCDAQLNKQANVSVSEVRLDYI
jgi:hypothetical protein